MLAAHATNRITSSNRGATAACRQDCHRILHTLLDRIEALNPRWGRDLQALLRHCFPHPVHIKSALAVAAVIRLLSHGVIHGDRQQRAAVRAVQLSRAGDRTGEAGFVEQYDVQVV